MSDINFFGSKLRARREQYGYSLAELARLAGCSRQQLINLEAGIVPSPGIIIIAKIAAVLSTDVNYFLGPDDLSTH